jgi:Cu/Zn superoxide dismutase
MKNQKLILLALSLFVAMTIMSCEKDNDSEIIPTDNKKEYTLAELNDSGVSGKATFTEFSDGSIEVNLDLSGTPSSGVHPAHIHFNPRQKVEELQLD